MFFGLKDTKEIFWTPIFVEQIILDSKDKKKNQEKHFMFKTCWSKKIWVKKDKSKKFGEINFVKNI